MFDNLSERLERSFKILKGEGKITEINVAETLKDPSDQHGSSEIGKGTHKYKQSCRQNCRHRQGHNHPLKPIHTFAAHALGRLQQRVVDIPECSVHIDYNQRKELQGLHKHNSSEPVDGYTVNPK